MSDNEPAPDRESQVRTLVRELLAARGRTGTTVESLKDATAFRELGVVLRIARTQGLNTDEAAFEAVHLAIDKALPGDSQRRGARSFFGLTEDTARLSKTARNHSTALLFGESDDDWAHKWRHELLARAIVRALLRLDVPDSTLPHLPAAYLLRKDSHWEPIDIPVLTHPPVLDKMITMARERHYTTFGPARDLTSFENSLTLEAIDPEVRKLGMFFRYPGVQLSRVGIAPIRNCDLDMFGFYRGYFSLDLCWKRPLDKGERRSIAFRVELSGSGDWHSWDEFQHEYDIGQLEMAVAFDERAIPTRGWWFDGIPLDAVPGVPEPSHQLELLTAPYRYAKRFGKRTAGPWYCGIAWDW